MTNLTECNLTIDKNCISQNEVLDMFRIVEQLIKRYDNLSRDLEYIKEAEAWMKKYESFTILIFIYH